MSSGPVRAAGGIVRRRDADGELVVAVVHRPKYDDWTFPKGKLDPGESKADAARREVEEETGLLCKLGSPIGKTRYQDARGRPKVVSYWFMDPADPEATNVPNDEVDELRWCRVDDAAALLTYDHDRALLERVRAEVA